MASSSVESAAKWLGNLLVEEVQYLADVKDKVADLQSELEWMQCFLCDVDVKQNKNALLRKWVSEIKDLALDAEDLIETYILKVSHKKQNKGLLDYLKCLASCLKVLGTLHNVGSDIDALIDKISKMSSRLERYGIKSSYDKYLSYVDMEKKMLAEQRRRTYSHIDDQDTVGLEESVATLVAKLQGGSQHKIVLVHGMGGIGKTTLARKVFKDERLKSIFSGFAWAYISQQLQLGSVSREILLQLIPKQNESERQDAQQSSDEDRRSKILDMLKQNNYLVVLDDVWSREDWICIKDAFLPLDDTTVGSKILITTRDRQILSGVSDDLVYYYQVNSLDPDKSWELLQKKAHFSELMNEGDSKKMELGKKMLDHCNGHPLAIAVLGGVLATKKSPEQWQSVYENLPSHLQGDESYIGVYEVLAMSYYELEYNMKACFLHLGNFPEDFEISAEKLYHLWIAEGIVSLAKDKVVTKRSLEETCQVFLNELVQKGMVQIGSRDSYGKIKTCRLHDLMRDKCLEINREENFLQIIDYHVSKSEHQPTSSAPKKKLHRMAIHIDREVPNPIPKSLSGQTLRLRSLLFFPSKDSNEGQNCACIVTICKDFQFLRVLDFEGLRLKGSLPKQIGNLIFMRYLSLKDTYISELPSSVENLRSLMILDLRVSKVFIKVPNLIWKIKSLRYLYLPFIMLSQEYGVVQQGYKINEGEMLKLDQLSQLEKLENVDLDRVHVDGLVELRSMRKFSATCHSNEGSLVPCLKSKSIKDLSLTIHANVIKGEPMLLSECDSLRVLHIHAERYLSNYLSISLEMFPPYLVELGFWYCKLPEDPMPILEKLSELRRLELHICYKGDALACSDKGFPELTYLMIDGLFSLREWTVEKGGLPKLQKVEIYNSPIRMLPDVLPSHVDIACDPCVKGIERYDTCPYFEGVFQA